MDIIFIPALILGGLGLLFGALLALASIIFRVDSDERIEKIIDLLPGANCGGCGFAGCAAFAEAIVKGNASASGCKVVSEDNLIEIASVMGVECIAEEKKVAFVKCHGTCEFAPDKYEIFGVDDCKVAYTLSGGPKKCSYGCMGLGSCVSVCKFDAIKIVDGIACVDSSKCVGCGSCVAVCPKKLIDLIPAEQKKIVACSSKDKGAAMKDLCKVGCIGCGICAKNCPEEAITVENFLATVNNDKCTDCGVCAEKCPKKIIVSR